MDIKTKDKERADMLFFRVKDIIYWTSAVLRLIVIVYYSEFFLWNVYENGISERYQIFGRTSETQKPVFEISGH
jgi:hypothetical protein